MTNCHSCGKPPDGTVIADIRFSGFDKERLNGVTVWVHGRCLRLEPTERSIALLPRVQHAEDAEIVAVYLDEGEWIAFCRDCNRSVAQKSSVDDAHLVAALHIARVHVAVPGVRPAFWTCEIGPADREALPEGCDLPMRQAVRAAFRELTGDDPERLSSGWGRNVSVVAFDLDRLAVAIDNVTDEHRNAFVGSRVMARYLIAEYQRLGAES